MLIPSIVGRVISNRLTFFRMTPISLTNTGKRQMKLMPIGEYLIDNARSPSLVCAESILIVGSRT